MPHYDWPAIRVPISSMANLGLGAAPPPTSGTTGTVTRLRLPTAGKKHRKHSKAEQADLKAIRALEPWLRTWAARALGAVGNIGDQPPLRALAAAVITSAAIRRDDRLMGAGWHMLLAHQIATAFKTIGKETVDRSRPRQLLASGDYKMNPGTSRDPDLRSFPSGHTAGAVAMARAIARDYP